MRFWKKSVLTLENSTCSLNNSIEQLQERDRHKSKFILSQLDSPEHTSEKEKKLTFHSSLSSKNDVYKKSIPPLSIPCDFHRTKTMGNTRVGLSIDISSSSNLKEPELNERQLQDYYAQTITKVDDYLYLTGEKGAHNAKMLEEYGITHIINCAGYTCKNVFLKNESNEGNTRYRAVSCPVEYMTLYLHDDLDEHIQTHFIQIINFIEKIRREDGGAKILVHCKMGISRAPSMVIAYLMWLNTMSYEEALQKLRRLRPVVGPNIGFVTELMEWESSMHDCLKKDNIDEEDSNN